mmetsp:Transcript_15527/g.23708  ORF Transcript_15527/g.23708 Transcript_15527/m.23708 type:complete len:80 (-) Transcript_15527:515-754(-)
MVFRDLLQEVFSGASGGCCILSLEASSSLSRSVKSQTSASSKLDRCFSCSRASIMEGWGGGALIAKLLIAAIVSIPQME